MYIAHYKRILLKSLPYIINGYLLIKLIFDQHGIMAVININKNLERSHYAYKTMHKMNNINQIKSELINQDVVNIQYLEEVLRLQYSVIKADEKVLIITD